VFAKRCAEVVQAASRFFPIEDDINEQAARLILTWFALHHVPSDALLPCADTSHNKM